MIKRMKRLAAYVSSSVQKTGYRAEVILLTAFSFWCGTGQKTIPGMGGHGQGGDSANQRISE